MTSLNGVLGQKHQINEKRLFKLTGMILDIVAESKGEEQWTILENILNEKKLKEIIDDKILKII